MDGPTFCTISKDVSVISIWKNGLNVSAEMSLNFERTIRMSQYGTLSSICISVVMIAIDALRMFASNIKPTPMVHEMSMFGCLLQFVHLI